MSKLVSSPKKILFLVISAQLFLSAPAFAAGFGFASDHGADGYPGPEDSLRLDAWMQAWYEEKVAAREAILGPARRKYELSLRSRPFLEAFYLRLKPIRLESYLDYVSPMVGDQSHDQLTSVYRQYIIPLLADPSFAPEIMDKKSLLRKSLETDPLPFFVLAHAAHLRRDRSNLADLFRGEILPLEDKVRASRSKEYIKQIDGLLSIIYRLVTENPFSEFSLTVGHRIIDTNYDHVMFLIANPRLLDAFIDSNGCEGALKANAQLKR